ncbi:MAG: hypothetical protein GXY83_27620 [Rhodopirellula sp.]|nr:hypothetical protein [Rhodopirellula sp.]
MGTMDGWSIVLVVVAAYIAVTSLVRLMVRHRDRLVGDFRGKMEAEKQRKKAKSKKPRQSGQATEAA